MTNDAPVEVEDEGARPLTEANRLYRELAAWAGALPDGADAMDFMSDLVQFEAAIRKEATAAALEGWHSSMERQIEDLTASRDRIAALGVEWRTRAEAAEGARDRYKAALEPFAKLDERPHSLDEVRRLVFKARRALRGEAGGAG